MSGLDRKTPIPTEITLHKKSRVLELGFEDGTRYQLPAEFLRVYSPSAEVRGHGPGQETLQTGKRNVEITDLEAVGNYAVKPSFSDGHDSGHDHGRDIESRPDRQLAHGTSSRPGAQGRVRHMSAGSGSARG